MTLTINTRVLMCELDEEDPRVRNTVNLATTNAMSTIREEGFKTLGDDRAAELEAAVYVYLRACQVGGPDINRNKQ